jgi:Zn-dependent oligopeptidase
MVGYDPLLQANANPLLQPYTVPPMDMVKAEHFEPAIDVALEEAGKKLAALKADSSTPDFENTVVALDQLLNNVNRVQYVLGTLITSKYDDELIALEEVINKKVAEFTKTVYQDKALADRFQAVAKPTAGEDQTLYKDISDTFESEGAFLAVEGQQRIKEIDDRLITLASKFMDNLNKGTQQQAVLFTDKEDIAGLPESVVSALRESAQEAGHNEGWLVVPERLQVDMLLDLGASRNFRQKVYEALGCVGTQEPHDNEPIIKEILGLRQERAKMLGYPDHASYALSSTMAGSINRANEFMDAVTDKALPKFEETVRLVQAFAAANDGPRKLEAWDLPYWAAQYKEKNYGFDAAKYSEYLPLDNVIDGFFKTAERVFDVQFKENTTYPKYHDDVRTYDVTSNKTGEHLGIIYADFFARDNKQGGAWMSELQTKSEGHPNIVTMNLNLMKPEAGKTTLLSIDDMNTLFHEGGHAMHGLIGTNTRHASLRGVNGSSDYIEFFSTVMESWMTEKDALDTYARHYKTGEKLPDELFEAMKRSDTFLAESKALKVAQNARRDFAFHTADPAKYTTSKALEDAADFKHPLSAHIRSYPLNRWSHLFSDGLSDYASCYYGYLWSEGLASLGFKPFQQKGTYDRQSSDRLARMYSYGVSRDMNQAFEELHGGKFTTGDMADALLQKLGADRNPRVSTFASSGKIMA